MWAVGVSPPVVLVVVVAIVAIVSVIVAIAIAIAIIVVVVVADSYLAHLPTYLPTLPYLFVALHRRHCS